MTTSLKVYRVQISGQPSPHYAVFIETDNEGAGIMFHVRRSIGITGTIYEKKHVIRPGPRGFLTIRRYDERGSVKTDDIDHFEQIAESITPPAQQYVGPVCQCYSWVQQVFTALEDDGVLETEGMVQT